MGNHELAQVNIARMKAPVDDPLLKDFVDAFDSVNALAEAAPGFVWRLKTEDGNATAIRGFEWDVRGTAGVLINMSVWESPDTLSAYVFSGEHLSIMRRRREWFHRVQEAVTALWWVPAGYRPTVAEAEEKIKHLRIHGPTPEAFTLRQTFPAPGVAGAPEVHDGRFCPA
ncbi:DUF3291 domain-containing protein [Pseudonocardiaceae bacterium YIM PH 21723]|nr:DUF3291 domain-containing protein [Pseudonocardiaceae bacterium YIM PH 21723]